MSNEIMQQLSYYRQQLKNSPEAIAYLKSRDITAATANYFKLGYAPLNPPFNNACNDRIIFPVKDTQGDYVAFVGRILKENDTRSKYWNSWESEEYQKGRILYGFADAFQYIVKHPAVILVEGQFDLLTLWQNGIKNVVAGSGTGFTAAHARLLARYATTVYIAFDSDNAGKKGLRKTSGFLQKVGLITIPIELPEKEDPDSFVRKNGVQSFLELCNKG